MLSASTCFTSEMPLLQQLLTLIEAWPESKSCDGAFVLVSKNLKKGEGALWEIDCLKQKGIPLRGVYIKGGTYSDKPDNLYGVTCKEWSWENVK